MTNEEFMQQVFAETQISICSQEAPDLLSIMETEGKELTEWCKDFREKPHFYYSVAFGVLATENARKESTIEGMEKRLREFSHDYDELDERFNESRNEASALRTELKKQQERYIDCEKYCNQVVGELNNLKNNSIIERVEYYHNGIDNKIDKDEFARLMESDNNISRVEKQIVFGAIVRWYYIG